MPNRQIGLATGTPGTLSGVSRIVKRVYDRVQDSYDGIYDESAGTCREYRTSFFSPDDLPGMAVQFGLNLGQRAIDNNVIQC